MLVKHNMVVGWTGHVVTESDCAWPYSYDFKNDKYHFNITRLLDGSLASDLQSWESPDFTALSFYMVLNGFTWFYTVVGWKVDTAQQATFRPENLLILLLFLFPDATHCCDLLTTSGVFLNFLELFSKEIPMHSNMFSAPGCTLCQPYIIRTALKGVIFHKSYVAKVNTEIQPGIKDEISTTGWKLLAITCQQI